MSTPMEILEAGKRYIQAERAFEQAKRDLDRACDTKELLPMFIWDNGLLYQLNIERAATPRFREIAPSLVAIAPAAG